MVALVVFFCILSWAAASPYIVPSYGNQAYEPVYEAKPEPYSFGFDTKDEYGTVLSRKEEGDELGNKRGSYGYVDSYGIYRQVDYVADDKGFRAFIKTNEPGTQNQNPADVEILSEAVPVNYDAPAVYAKAPVSAAYYRPAAVVTPAYARPEASVSLSPATPLAPAYGRPGPSVFASGPVVYGSDPAVYATGPEAYGPAQSTYGPAQSTYVSAPEAYGPAQSTYALAPEAYGPAPAAYSASPIYEPLSPQAYGGPSYEPLSPQAYGGPSYEQLSDRASEPTESRNAYE